MNVGKIDTGIYLSIFVLIEDIKKIDIESFEQMIQHLNKKMEIIFFCEDTLLNVVGTLTDKNVKFLSIAKIKDETVYHYARGKYILFLNNEDILFPHNLNGLLNFLQITSSDAIRISGVYHNQSTKVNYDGQNQVKVRKDVAFDKIDYLPKDIEKRLLLLLENKLHDNYSSVLYKREFLDKEHITMKSEFLFSREFLFYIECMVKATSYQTVPAFLIIEPDNYTRLSNNMSIDDILFEQEKVLEYITSISYKKNINSNVVDNIIKLYIDKTFDKLPNKIKFDLNNNKQILLNQYISNIIKCRDKYKILKNNYAVIQNANNANNLIIEQLMYDVKRIGIFGSSYTFLLYTLIFKDWQNALLLFDWSMPKNISNNIKKRKVPCFSATYPYPIDFSVLDKLSVYAEKYNIPVYGNDDSQEAGFFVRHNFIGVEDGSLHIPYQKAKEMGAHLIDKNGKGFIPYGFCEDEKKVYFTDKQPIPKEILHKAEIIDIVELWHKKEKTSRKKY